MTQHDQVPSASQQSGPSKLWSRNLKIPFPSFNKRSILIAVMGMTGAGKTSFIKHITGLGELKIGHGLKSCTKEIQVATTKIDGHDVHLIDTPGFNDDELNDTDILAEIANYLSTDVHLSGILYLHPISDGRIGGTGVRNLELLRNLVGPDNMGNVKLITTKWHSNTFEENEVRLKDLISDYWMALIAAGAHVDRYNGTREDGIRIVQSILQTSPVTLLFQQEILDGRRLEQTSAGKGLMEAFRKLQEKYNREVEDLKASLAADRAADRERYEEALRRRDEAAEQARRLHEAEINRMEGRIKELEDRWRCLVM